MREAFHTLAREARHEIDKIKGSRFVGIAAPVADADEALQLVERALVTVCARVEVEFPYECERAVRGTLAAFELEAERADYAEAVRLELRVPVGRLEELRRDFLDRTAARGALRQLD